MTTTCSQCGRMLGAHREDGVCPDCVRRVALMESQHERGWEDESLADDFLPASARRFRDLNRLCHTLRDSGGKHFGDYELIQSLGHGAMGEVFKARHIRLNRLVALKMIRQGRYASENERHRFLSEAEAIA